MSYKKQNNKGFTLVELIIAISIFSIVIFMGYKVINGSNKATKEQANIISEQQAANLVNKYLTKDLELCKTINSLDTTELDKYRNEYTKLYGYRITNNQGSTVDYVVGIEDKYYSLIRIKDNTSIPIIENLRIEDENVSPFTIEAEKNVENSNDRNLYTVNISNVDKKFEFKVNSRYTSASGLDGGGGSPPEGKGHIIVHKTGNNKSVIINSSNEQGEYKEEIKVSKCNDGKTVGINIKDYKIKIIIDSYVGGTVTGSIIVNESQKEFGPVDIRRNMHSFNHEGLSIVVRKEEYKDRDDDDNDDLIIEINNGSTTLVKLEKDNDDDELDVKLYNDEVDIEIDEDGEVEIDIGDENNSKMTTYDDGNEIEIDIASKYISNIYGMYIKSVPEQTYIKSVKLNDEKYDSFDYINFNPEIEKEIELDIKASDTNENMVIVDFSNDNKNSELKPIGENIRVEHLKNEKSRGNDTYLKVSLNNREIGKLQLGDKSNNVEVETRIKTSTDRKTIEIELVSNNERGRYEIEVGKKVKGVKIDNSSVKKLRTNIWTELDTKSMNSGGGVGNQNNEFTLILLGDK